MTLTLRAAVILGVLLSAPLGGVAGVAHADEDGAAPRPSTLGEALARLASTRDAEVAWGAYVAGRDGHEEAVPALLEALQKSRDSDEGRWSLVRRSLLDALIRLDASVPEPLLAEVERGLAIHVLVLRAKDPKAHTQGLLDHFDRRMGGRKIGLYAVATGNLLLRTRPAGFTRRLLDRLPLELRVNVYTPSPAFRGIGGGRSIGGGFGDAVAKVPEGFPPYAWYTIQTTARRGARLLVDGPRPVYMRRVERATSGLVGGGPSHRFDANTCRVEWAAELLGLPKEKLAFASEDRTSLAWSTSDAYVAHVVRARTALEAPYWTLVRRLRDAALLSDEEARGVVPDVTIDVVDERSEQDRAEDLPPLPPLERPEDLQG